jgi:methylenetetrahydrofolate reductase (NADPH)
VDARSYADDIAHLAAKVAAGGDYVLTQHFFSVARFGAFVADARAAGVSVPIIPGLMPIHNYESFSRIVRFTRAAVPPTVLAALEPIATDDEAVKRYGIVLCSQMCSELLEVEGVHGVHFYTLNLEQIVTEVLSRQGFERVPASRAVPWQHARPAADGADGLGAQAKRPGEAVRPIFWANRPHSYVDRTAHWDEFPNGRWGDRTYARARAPLAPTRSTAHAPRARARGGGSARVARALARTRAPTLAPAAPARSRARSRARVRSPAFGELSLHHSTKLHTLRASERRAAWGHQLLSMRDVCETFVRYVRGQIPMLPWCELALANESGRIVERLALLNARGMLTINSQPPVDGAPSHDPDVGWGGPGGYVYQKAYVEMFVSPRTLDAIVEAMARHPSLSYQALDVRGRCRHNFVRTEDDGGVAACVCAVTWGVFPGKEIVQPTVVDSEAFVQWASEAFELWRSQWSSLYPADSPSRVVLERVHRDWWLLNVVDHDYKGGDLFALFTDVADKLGPEGAEDLRA